MKKLFFSFICSLAIFIVNAQEPVKVTTLPKTTIDPVDTRLNKTKLEINHLYTRYKKQMEAAKKTMAEIKTKLQSAMKDLESKDKMGNFEIQDLMSQFNQAETQSSNAQKKLDDTRNAVIGKIGG